MSIFSFIATLFVVSALLTSTFFDCSPIRSRINSFVHPCTCPGIWYIYAFASTLFCLSVNPIASQCLHDLYTILCACPGIWYIPAFASTLFCLSVDPIASQCLADLSTYLSVHLSRRVCTLLFIHISAHTLRPSSAYSWPYFFMEILIVRGTETWGSFFNLLLTTYQF